MGHQLTGKIEFHDKENQLYGYYDMGSVKKKVQDYFQGQITHYGKKICEVYGSYMGYMDFNGQRYFDIRHNEDIYYPIILDGETALESDSTKREDSVTLAAGDQDAAQKRKEELEELQRKDRRLREAAHQRREKGGKKFANIF